MQFLEFLYLLQKRGLSYEIYGNCFLFSKNMDYHMQYLEFHSLLEKHGLSYVIYGISIPSPKTWTIICNFGNFFPFSKNMDYHMQVSRIPFSYTKTYSILWNLWN